MNLEKSIRKLYDRVVFSVYFLLIFGHKHFCSCENKKASKNIHNPAKLGNQCSSDKNENKTHHNSP